MYNFKEINTISNYFSFLRLLLAIPFWFLLDHFSDPNTRYFIFALILFASFTDIMDGYLARKFNQITEVGKIIDPLADKICIAIIILKLYLIGEIPDYYFYMIIGRDLIIFIGGIFVTKMLGKVLPSNYLGKITVLVIGFVILFITLQMDRSNLVFKAFYFASILLIFASLIAYIIRSIEFIKQRKYGSV